MLSFSKKARHLGTEISVAFFRMHETEPQITNSHAEGMVCVNLNEISPHDSVEFDLYIYLPINRKFVLYKRPGGVLEEEQRKALQENGVSEFHLERSQLPQLEKYKARSSLNSLIHELNLEAAPPRGRLIGTYLMRCMEK